MINIVIPMAGRGQRFTEAGYDKPKPLIDVVGVPMIKRVIDSLTLRIITIILFLLLYKNI